MITRPPCLSGSRRARSPLAAFHGLRGAALAVPFLVLCALTAPLERASGGDRFLSEGDARKLFPAELKGYKLDSVKLKPKSDAWVEYSATYKPGKSEKELKVVINDVPPSGDPKWADQFAKSDDYIGEWPTVEVKGEDKYSVLVWVKPRFRVDFKSREVSSEKIRAMAEAFPFGPLEKVASRSNQ